MLHAIVFDEDHGFGEVTVVVPGMDEVFVEYEDRYREWTYPDCLEVVEG